MVVSAIAVLSFIGVYDTTLFFDHMIQHLMLVMIAAAGFAAGAPVRLALMATSGKTKERIKRILRSKVALVLGHPFGALVLYGVLVPLTHLTFVYNDAVRWRYLDGVEHLAFLFVGYLFWRQIFSGEPNGFRVHPAMRALILFLAVPVDTFVGLSLDSQQTQLFPALAAEHRHWGIGPIMDLHVGGVIMWVGGDTLMMLALFPVVAAWVHLEERRAMRVDKELMDYYGKDGTHWLGENPSKGNNAEWN
jgi:putative copper resistance protein D